MNCTLRVETLSVKIILKTKVVVVIYFADLVVKRPSAVLV